MVNRWTHTQSLITIIRQKVNIVYNAKSERKIKIKCWDVVLHILVKQGADVLHGDYNIT